MSKLSSDPSVAKPEVKIQVQDLVLVVGAVSPFAPQGVNIRGKVILSRPWG